jgi:hypothetical protein
MVMMASGPSLFAQRLVFCNEFTAQSEITHAYERLSLRALGFFVIHVMDRCYGVNSADATMLANSFDTVCRRIVERGRYNATFALDPDAGKIASSVSRAIYCEPDENELFFGMTKPQFTDIIYSNDLLWAPDGDEAFDDGSYVLQFDVGEKVRLIAFRRAINPIYDPESLRDAWLAADDFYGILQNWCDVFKAEWTSLPKINP